MEEVLTWSERVELYMRSVEMRIKSCKNNKNPRNDAWCNSFIK